MYLDVLTDANILMTISVIITSLYLIAFALSVKNWRLSPSVFILSCVLFINFFVANNNIYGLLFGERDIPTEIYYLNWLRDDALSIIITIFAHLTLRVKIQKITAFLMWILVINIALYAAMHIDIVVLNNRTEPWWLWTIYSTIINLVEFVIAAFIIAYQFMNRSKAAQRSNVNGI